ncbi:MAG: hypothetical protein ACM3XS_00920 [Bacteroidota bacterium]
MRKKMGPAAQALDKLRKQARTSAEAAGEKPDPERLEEAVETVSGAKTARSEDRESWRKQ